MPFHKLEGRIVVPTGGWTMTISENGGGGVAVVVAPAGNYMLNSADGTLSLLASIAATLTAEAGLAATYALTCGDNTDTAIGDVTISASGGGVTQFAITWTSTDLRDVLGFQAGQPVSGFMGYVGNLQARYLWLPNCDPFNAMVPAGHRGLPLVNLQIPISNDGSSVAHSFGERRINNYELPLVLGLKSWISEEQTTNESLERFFEDVLRFGLKVRYYPDRSNDAAFVDLRFLIDRLNLRPLDPRWTMGARSQWGYQADVIEYVGA